MNFQEWLWFTGLIIAMPFALDESLIFFGVFGTILMLGGVVINLFDSPKNKKGGKKK